MKIVVKYKIKEVREQKKMTVRKLAELSGVSKSYISEIENGKKMPAVYIICLLAVALEVDARELYSYRVL